MAKSNGNEVEVTCGIFSARATVADSEWMSVDYPAQRIGKLVKRVIKRAKERDIDIRYASVSLHFGPTVRNLKED